MRKIRRKLKQSDVVLWLREIFGKENVIVLNASRGNRHGIFDTIIAVYGEPIFVEIKILPDSASKMQKEFLDTFFDSAIILLVKQRPDFSVESISSFVSEKRSHKFDNLSFIWSDIVTFVDHRFDFKVRSKCLKTLQK